ncbi:type 1 glutamine amidotransferase domain-containing protein [Flavihumibacter rivuli]|uniref:type 1 glutamine amidotransferase domain-containing protein n=1 Tax=Flavihumibacter rivuli TaxID=2838156 RepID=UPI001BDE235A|nr:type 1 glutamine amidotransferase domain-containing protein [Flavihumibacter rivuli]ULQ56813.1 type 1 glutamine amidotransferase domain-containing protein [Flavihumibacter rivuli]
MSAAINTLDAGKPKRIALIAANASTSQQTGWPIGFWWAELTHPYWEFREKGYAVDIFSPEGGALQADGFSDPEHESGYSAHDLVSLGFKHSPSHAQLLEQTRPISEININDYDGVFLTGGQSPMYTFINNTALHQLVARFHEAKKAVGIVCHATCVLLKATGSDGKLLVEGKTWTGFADSEEQFADNFVGMKIQPFWIETEAKKIPNTNFITGGLFKPFAVRDGNLITGQQQYSGAATARLMIEALGV